MAKQTGEAYDLRLFENREERKLQVVENQNRKKLARRKNFHGMKIIFVTALLLGLIASVLTTNNVVTQLAADIYEAQTQLDEARAQGDYLSDQLSSAHDLTQVEAYAEQIGLVKMHGNEVYYTLETENEIEVQNGTKNMLDDISAGFMNLMEYLLP